MPKPKSVSVDAPALQPTVQKEMIHIDEWYAREDKAVDEAFAEVLSSARLTAARRRTLDQDEIQRRVDKQIQKERAEFGRLLAAARKICRLSATDEKGYGFNLISEPEPREYIADAYRAEYGEELADYELGVSKRAAFERQAAEVRKEVVAQMLEERIAGKQGGLQRDGSPTKTLGAP